MIKEILKILENDARTTTKQIVNMTCEILAGKEEAKRQPVIL